MKLDEMGMVLPEHSLVKGHKSALPHGSVWPLQLMLRNALQLAAPVHAGQGWMT